jgi:hypothetical protein
VVHRHRFGDRPAAFTGGEAFSVFLVSQRKSPKAVLLSTGKGPMMAAGVVLPWLWIDAVEKVGDALNGSVHH